MVELTGGVLGGISSHELCEAGEDMKIVATCLQSWETMTKKQP